MAFITFSILYSIFSLLIILGFSSAKSNSALNAARTGMIGKPKNPNTGWVSFVYTLSAAISIILGVLSIFSPAFVHPYLFYIISITSIAIIMGLIPPINFGNFFLRMIILVSAILLLF